MEEVCPGDERAGSLARRGGDGEGVMGVGKGRLTLMDLAVGSDALGCASSACVLTILTVHQFPAAETEIHSKQLKRPDGRGPKALFGAYVHEYCTENRRPRHAHRLLSYPGPKSSSSTVLVATPGCKLPVLRDPLLRQLAPGRLPERAVILFPRPAGWFALPVRRLLEHRIGVPQTEGVA